MVARRSRKRTFTSDALDDQLGEGVRTKPFPSGERFQRKFPVHVLKIKSIAERLGGPAAEKHAGELRAIRASPEIF